MEAHRTDNLALRRALAEARLRGSDVAERMRVDPKTVQRWLAGRRPQPQHRWALAQLVGVHEFDLWPDMRDEPAIDPEVIAVYTHRSGVLREAWHHLLGGAERQIGVLVYSGLFLAEDVDLVRVLSTKASQGVDVRILLGDPDSPVVADRGRDEGIGEAMSAKIQNAQVLLAPLVETGTVQLRQHATVLYTSIYRADDDMLANQHVLGVGAAHAPVMHLRRRDGGQLFDTYATSFERVWNSAAPLP
jgi:transcriptional regulator with XRE-family HTH domain